MNRGRRRGRPGLTGLRDGVKRRLFDPHLVPIKPDAKYAVNRLTPLNYVKPSVESHLNQLRQSNIEDNTGLPEQSSTQLDRLVQNLFNTKAKMEIAFRNSRFYHPLPRTTEGIDIQRLFKGGTVVRDEPNNTFTPLLSHLLLVQQDIQLSSDGHLFSDLEDPDHWYPVELVQFTKQSRKSQARRVRRKRTQEKKQVQSGTEDLKELVTDEFIQRAFEAVDTTVDDEVAEKPTTKDAQDGRESGGDSDDDRWNGEVKPAGDDGDLDDEEELDNDYCQTYFDNGEGDLSDELNVGDDDDGEDKRYYD